MRPHHDRRIAATLPFHDPKNHSNVCYPHGMTPLASMHRGFCTITGLISLLRTMVGSTPSNVFSSTRIAPRYTRMTWMRLAMIYLGNLGLACNFETYRYSLQPAHMPLLFSCIYTTSSPLRSRTSPHEVNHHYICFIPHIQLILHLSRFFFFSLTISQSTTQCESRLY
jgi:hypothetical protein